MTIYVNNYMVESFKFPGGEIHVCLSEDIRMTLCAESTCVDAWLYSSDDIFELLLTINAVRNFCRSNVDIILRIPYLPYARQDRVCNEGEAFSLKVMEDIIDSLNVKSVKVYDPHSRIKYDTMDMGIILLTNFLEKQIIFPDEGAKNRYKYLTSFDISFKDKDIRYASKVRCPKTGEITSTCFDVTGCKNDLIIIDDICDGGKTFIELAKIIREDDTKDIKRNLCLYVTHGIFSKGFEELKKYFDHIYCYHTFLFEDELDNEFLTIFSSHRRKRNVY
jgi:ribose-phosphate pyrophosphokinase